MPAAYGVRPGRGLPRDVPGTVPGTRPRGPPRRVLRPQPRALARVCPMATRSDGSGPGGTGDAFFRPSVRALTPYQPGKPVEDVQRELGLERVVKLASNEGPFGPFPAAEEALARSVGELNRYPDGGSYRLHAALAERHGVSFEQVASAPAPTAASTCSARRSLDPGDEIVCGWPSFPSYVIYAAKQGAVPRTVELAEHRYDLDALLDAVTPRTKLVYICHPNNPTGTMNTTDELDRYFERVPEHVLTVVDQAYFEYIDRPDYPDAVERYLKAGRQVAVLRTFSKIYGLAGLRVGYAVAPRERLRGDGEGAPPVRHHLARAGRRAREHRRGRRARAAARASTPRGSPASSPLLREHGLAPVPSVGNFLYVDTGGDANALYERLLHEGVIVRPLDRLRVDHGDPRLRRRARRARPPRGRARTGAAARPDRLCTPRSAARCRMLRTAPSFRLLFLATLGSGHRHLDGDDRAHGRHQRPDGLAVVGERALHRHLPAVGDRRPRRRPARRPALAQEADRRRRRRAASASSPRCRSSAARSRSSRSQPSPASRTRSSGRPCSRASRT